jgi:type VI secretion system protein ImpA
MPLREDLLTPIPGDNPSGPDIRYDSKVPIYDEVKDARRHDDDLAQGDWQRERKVADYAKVIRLTQDALATKTKDLQLAAWLVDALLHTQGFSGLSAGLTLCHDLTRDFWDTINPPLEDGDEEPRMAHLDWIGSSLEISLKSLPLTREGHNWFKYKESRLVGYEEEVKGDKEKKIRAQRVAEGKLTPEVFDKAFVETPKAFYLQSEKDLDRCLKALGELDELCGQKFTTSRPTFGKLQAGLEDVRDVVHALLEKKRETEPDPVEEVTPEPVPGDAVAAEGAAAAPGAAAASTISFSVLTSSEPPDRREAIASVARVAAFLRKREPYSPAPYLMMRGLRWGELRSAPQLADSTLLEAPPTELRQHLKRLAIHTKWNELLEAAENAMSLPCSRGWLDLQRLVVGACSALGSDYDAIATAITSELRALLNDVPQLLDANLLDDTPAANAETKDWLKQMNETPVVAVVPVAEGANTEVASNGHRLSSWLDKAADPYIRAKEAQKNGQPEKAFEIMRREIARQTSGRGRFERTIQLVELCMAAGKEAIAQPLLDDIASAIEVHKLDDWEDKKMVAGVLMTLMTTSKKVQGSSSEKQKLFERICRLDPVRALTAG